MNTPLQFLAATAMACVSCATLAAPASAPAAAKTDGARAGEQCESAVAETVRRMRGPGAREVEFMGAKRAIAPPGDGDEIGVKGEGRYRSPAGSTIFTYSCAFHAQTGTTSGVMFRETGGAAPGREANWEPDLTNVSPDACETAAAAQLKQKYPRVDRIAFDAATRQLRPATNARTSLLEGRGAVQRAPGMNAVPFSYRCEFETASGAVSAVQTVDSAQ